MNERDAEDNRDLYELFALARKHGEEGEVEDGATHEVGDLQELCEAMWNELTSAQRSALLESDVVQGLRAEAGE